MSRFIAILFVFLPALSQAQDVVPGLIAEYKDSQSTIRTVVSTPNFRLASDESLHPSIAPKFSATWTGVLRVRRGGDYTIQSGDAEMQIDGKQVGGDAMALSAGDHPLVIKYQRSANEARLQLRWSTSFFAEEPIPSSAFGHAKKADTDVAGSRQIEKGRLLFAELGCGNCHESGSWNLATRRGPDLSNVGGRVHTDWISGWLNNPQHYRASAAMPKVLKDEGQRKDVTAFLASLVQQSYPTNADSNEALQKAGKELFEQVGCTKCHDKNNSLEGVGAKFKSADAIAQFIADPHKTDPHGRMPQLFTPATEIHLVRQIAEYLFHSQKKKLAGSDYTGGDAKRGEQLFTSSGCASCHTTNTSERKLVSTIKAPAFGKSSGLPLRHFWNFDQQVKDQAGNNHGKIVGAKKFNASGASGNSFEFDGRNYIQLTHFPRPDLMTISAWIKTERGGQVISWGRPGGGRRGSRELRINIGQDGKNSICYGEYNSDGGWRPVIQRPSDVNLIDNEWHHVAVVRKGTAIQIYVDGKAKGNPGRSQRGPGDYTDRLAIGALVLSSNPGNRFRGLIDDLSIWEMALSAEQVKALFDGVSPLQMARPEQAKVAAFSPTKGCLADNVADNVPAYALSDEQRGSLRAFLTSVQPGKPLHQAPLSTLAMRIKQFRCTACHELDDTNKQNAVRVDDDGRIIRVERPPILTGVGEKLTSEWLQAILLEHKRNRPWLKLRMPHFGDAIAELPDLLPKSAGTPATDPTPTPKMELAHAGLETIGVQRGQVACIACHNYRGINRQKDGVVPAPDLSEAARTVRRDWFIRWMRNPSRLQPGTSMPQFFLELSTDKRDQKISELWAALVHQERLPLPDGLLKKQTEGTRIVVKDQPVLFRMATRTPVGQIDRAINVGLPGGLNYTFDAATSQLRYAWKGTFIDAGPAWNGRGGNPVNAGGQSLLQLPDNFPIRIGSNDKPKSIRFRGYRLVEKQPVFRYEVDGKLVEQKVTLAEDQLTQTFTVQAPGAEVRYVGDSKLKFTSDVGQWSDSTLVVPEGDVVKFNVSVSLNK